MFYTEPSVENLMARLERLESAAANGSLATTPAEAPRPKVPEDSSVQTTLAAQPVPAEEENREAPPEMVEPVPKEVAPEEAPTEETDGRRGDVDLAGQWVGIMDELKRRKQALTAAVYGEARVEGFDGAVLRLTFPEDQSFYVGMAKDRKHADVLGEVLEERVGSRPRLEVRTGEESPETVPTGGTPPSGPGTPPDAPRDTLPEPPVLEEEPPGVWEDEGTGQTMAGTDGPGTASAPSGAGGGDGTIRSEAEVFEMARGLGLFDQNKGS